MGSKTRKKKAENKITKEPLPSRPLRLRRHRFLAVRNNIDFVTFVKIGRIVNAIAFGLQCLTDYKGDKTPVGRRQYTRSIFITAGYVYEAILVIESVRIRYVQEEFYQEFLTMFAEEDFRAKKKLLHDIRNIAAFHFDHNGNATKEALATLNLPAYDMMSANSMQAGEFYFDFADIVDLNFLVDRYKGNRPEKETGDEILMSVVQMMEKLFLGSHRLLLEIGKKLHLPEALD